MATPRKKAAPVPQQAPDALNTDKASFTAKLIDRIEKGKELVDRSITNVQELEANETDFYKWNDYNSEYLKQSFNRQVSLSRIVIKCKHSRAFRYFSKLFANRRQGCPCRDSGK